MAVMALVDEMREKTERVVMGAGGLAWGEELGPKPLEYWIVPVRGVSKL